MHENGKKLAKHKNENTQRFLGKAGHGTEEQESEEREERGKESGKEKKVVAAVVDCRALTLAGHKAISKFHLF